MTQMEVYYWLLYPPKYASETMKFIIIYYSNWKFFTIYIQIYIQITQTKTKSRFSNSLYLVLKKHAILIFV